MLNKRQKNIISILKEQSDWITSKNLSNILGVSDRTIRSDINTINEHYKCQFVESNIRQGYCINDNNKKILEDTDAQLFPQIPNERCIYIIRKLLFESRELNLVLLQEQIYVSGYSIDNDIKKIRKMLNLYSDLKLVRSKEYIRLEGSEESKRKLYKDLLATEIQENFLNMNQLASLYKDFDLITMKDTLIEVIDEYGYSVNETLFTMLLLHLGTSIERILQYKFINLDESSDYINETIEYQISKTFFEKLTKKIDITIVESEIKLFALLIMRKKSFNYTNDYVCLNNKWINTRKLIEDMLEKINDLFGIDFRADSDLIAGLKMHIYGLIERKKNNIQIENIFLDEIRLKYPLVFEMGIYAGEFIEKELNIIIEDTEVGFIALHLGAASERVNANRKYKAILILPHNQSFASMCVSKISDIFSERMEIIHTFSFFEKKEIIRLNPDIILTTFPLVHGLDILTIQISMFVDSETESNILQALNKLDKKRFQVEFTSKIGSLIKKDYFYSDLEMNDFKEVIEFMCDKLEKGKLVNSEFRDSVLKREEVSPTSFGYPVAIPHAFGAFLNCSTISVAQLKYPIKWGDSDVRLVMLFAINEEDHSTVKMFFNWLSNIINNPKSLSLLYNACEYDEFIEKIIT